MKKILITFSFMAAFAAFSFAQTSISAKSTTTENKTVTKTVTAPSGKAVKKSSCGSKTNAKAYKSCCKKRKMKACCAKSSSATKED